MSTEELSHEDDLASLLAACDEALAAGNLATLRPGSGANGEPPRLQRDLACVRLLRELWPAQRSRPADPAPVAPGAALGRFVLGRELGSGGFGIVFLAYDPQLCREAALKVPRPEALLTPELRSRFQQEARAAAGLDHPNIVQVYEAGEAGPISYIASAYCPGPTLAQWLRQRTEPVPIREAAELVARLADAVQHAHSRGVLHRDLKPANVLLSPEASRERERPEGYNNEELNPSGRSRSRLAEYAPRITDFGLAKCLDAPNANNPTRSSAILGTPSYMAPEQATGKNRDVGPATDVYALGVILYELLTGRVPFLADTALETLFQVRDADPISPTRLRPRLPRDLETICLKCLRKEPEKRYATAADLATDLGRFLAGRPVRARPAGLGERFVKWVRRQPLVAGLLALVSLVTCLGIAGVVWQGLEAERGRRQAIKERDDKELARQEEERQRQVAEANLYAHSIPLAYREWQANDVRRTEEILDRCPIGRRDWEWAYVRRLCNTELQAWSADGLVNAVDFSPDGKWLASAHFDRLVRIWDIQSGKLVRTLDGHTERPLDVRFSPDGNLLAAGGNPSLGRANGPGDGVLKLWDQTTGRQRELVGHHSTVLVVAFRPEQPQLASTGLDKTVRIWDVTTGKELRRLAGLEGYVSDLAYSPDGKTLATAGDGHLVRLWDADTGQQRLACQGHSGYVDSVAFRPDGKLLASTSRDGTLRLWDPATGVPVRTCAERVGSGSPVRFSPDGREVVCLTPQQHPQIIDANTGLLKRLMRGRNQSTKDLAWSPDGRVLAAGGLSIRPGGPAQGTVLLWDMTAEQQSRVLLPARPGPTPVHNFLPSYTTACSSTGRWLAREEAGTLRLYDGRSGRPERILAAASQTILEPAFSSDETRLAAVVSLKGKADVQVWDTQPGEPLRLFKEGRGLLHTVALSPDGRLVAAGAHDGTVRVWDVETGQLRFASGQGEGGLGLAFAPDGQLLASTGSNGQVKLWDVAVGREVGQLRGQPGLVIRAAFSPDGSRLATAGTDAAVSIWDVAERKLLRTLAGYSRGVSDVVFHPGGRRLATTSPGEPVKLWDAETGQELLALAVEDDSITRLTFSSDGATLFGSSSTGMVRLWEAAPQRPEARP